MNPRLSATLRWLVPIPILAAAYGGALVTDWVGGVLDYDYDLSVTWSLTALLVQFMIVGSATIALALTEGLREPSTIDHLRYTVLLWPSAIYFAFLASAPWHMSQAFLNLVVVSLAAVIANAVALWICRLMSKGAAA